VGYYHVRRPLWPVAKKAHGAAVVWSELLTLRGWPYPSFWPIIIEVSGQVKMISPQSGLIHGRDLGSEL
jgi:hypothetical protein